MINRGDKNIDREELNLSTDQGMLASSPSPLRKRKPWEKERLPRKKWWGDNSKIAPIRTKNAHPRGVKGGSTGSLRYFIAREKEAW